MPRLDLLALSLDDLAALTTRGTVKRVERKIKYDECIGENVETPQGDGTAKWSDGVECRIAAPASAWLRWKRTSAPGRRGSWRKGWRRRCDREGT
ncbi:MAG TPA: hypothetical protein VMF69_19795 [Gemmataceae bacterium]|nr:hypothetical protein [Gemmataceae bacterium]